MRNSRAIKPIFVALSIFLTAAITASAGTLLDVAFTSASVTAKTGLAATGVSAGDFWNTCSGAALPDLDFVDGTLSGAGLTIAGVYGGVSDDGAWDPMYAGFLYAPGGHTLTVTITNLPAGMYDFYVYGHGTNSYDNGVYQVFSGAQSYGTESTVMDFDWNLPQWQGQEGIGFVEFTNVNILSGEAATIVVAGGQFGFGLALIGGLQMALVGPPIQCPVIFGPPVDQLVLPGATATFNVAASGQAPLTYQWLFDNAPIAGATNSTYTVTNAQPVNVGFYSVELNNPYGSVTSAPAQLLINSPSIGTKLIDVAFTGGPVTAETGFAATGVTTNDFWNSFNELGGVLTNLEFVDGTPSGAGIIESGANGVYGNGASDPMYSTYLYSSAGNITVSVIDLIPGTYAFYIYGHGNLDNEYSFFQLSVGSQSYGSGHTDVGSEWSSSAWQPGIQYVEFTNVTVLPGQTATITVAPGSGGFAVLAGLQMASVGPPVILTQPTNQSVLYSSNATFSASAIGVTPLTYQWVLNGASIAAATNSTYSVTNAQSANAGTYALIASNAGGTAISAFATLTVVDSTVFFSQPEYQEVFQGSNAAFGVAVDGAPPVTYQWLFNGGGTTASAFVVTNAEPAADGSYSVIVANAYGIVTSAVATLIVPPVPVLFTQPTNQVTLFGSNVTFSALVHRFVKSFTDSCDPAMLSRAWPGNRNFPL